MATHSSLLAWEALWTEEPGGPRSWGRKESDMTEYRHCHLHLWQEGLRSDDSCCIPYQVGKVYSFLCLIPGTLD